MTVAYAASLVYGSLYPLSGWTTSSPIEWQSLHQALQSLSFADVISNVAVYAPFGLLLALPVDSVIGRLVVAGGGAAVMSMTMEGLQLFLPTRYSSSLDIVLNVAGALLGAMAASLATDFGRPGRQARPVSIRNHHVWQVGALGCLLWLGAELFPLVPSLDPYQMRQGIKPLWYVLTGQASPNLWRFAYFGFASAAVAGAASLLLDRRRALHFVAGGLAVLLVGKVLIVGRALSVEASGGALIGVGAWMVTDPERRNRPGVVAGLVIAALLLEGLRVMPGPAGNGFNWVPFRAQLQEPLTGIADIMADLWAPLILVYLRLRDPRRPYAELWAGAALLATLYAVIEILQTWIPGRFGDITDIILPVAAWVVGWLYVERAVTSTRASRNPLGWRATLQARTTSRSDDTESTSND